MLSRAFYKVCSAHPSKVAIRCAGRPPVTYASLADAVTQVSLTLPSGPCTVAIAGPSPVDTTIAILAAWRNGAIAVPMCTAHTATERAYTLEDSHACVVLNGLVPTSTTSSPLLGETNDALMIYTSGTTGKPKGVVHTHGSVYSQVSVLQEAWQWAPTDVALNNLPMHHVHGLINITMCALFSGACVEFAEFDKTATLAFLRDSDVNVLMSVPTVYAKLCDSYDKSLDAPQQAAWTSAVASRMRLVVSGSAALPPPLKKRFETMSGCRVLERYGMTEAGMILSQSYTDSVNGRIAGTVGRPLPGVVARVGEAGELSIQSPSMFRTYWNRPSEVTAKEFTKDGFFLTGDTVAVDAVTGDYRIEGRTSVDIAKVAGYKISTLEVEAVVLSMGPGLADECVAFGVPDATYGEAIVVVVVGTATVDAVNSHCGLHLVRYKLPRRVVVTTTPLPRNAMGKVSKKEIAKMTW